MGKFVRNPNFYQGQAIAEILSILDSTYTEDTLYQVWFNLANSRTKSKKTYFKIL